VLLPPPAASLDDIERQLTPTRRSRGRRRPRDEKQPDDTT
jgi:hypothetical protein